MRLLGLIAIADYKLKIVFPGACWAYDGHTGVILAFQQELLEAKTEKQDAGILAALSGS